ncbi:hypothetical protein CkaCkLH20_03271 [Colletotrichum karsti]|uniref:Uncharacterized protein n=1 Tax=Colletotrichum karsti TaxID=1095194 RepID=A0A9P6I897_9PEZI|nr:uncharacterized protein CkaCkLH20_03271 [Colletotrichum karsti]KAF9879038.1 hypothetical protein CkaCkLH20_03271 [Colletotrichum karsti]
MAKINLGFNELRQELRHQEIHSEPELRSEYGMRMYSAPARSVPDQQPYWDDLNGGQPDLHQQEMDQLLEGRRLEPQSYGDPRRQGGFYSDKVEFDRLSTMSSRVDPEHMQRAIQAGVQVALSELDGYAFPPSPTAQRSSTHYGAGDPSRPRQSAWQNGIYRSETAVPQSTPFDPPESPTQRRRVPQHASNTPQTEAEWVGRPRRHRAAREAAREMNTAAQRSNAPARAAAQADNVGAPLSRAEPPRSRTLMSGGRGPTYEEVREETEAGTLVRRIPADQVGPRRQHPNGYQEPYFEDGEEEDFMSDGESDGSRLRPPPAPEPPR